MAYEKMKKGKSYDKGMGAAPGHMVGKDNMYEQRGNNYKGWAQGIEKHDRSMLKSQMHKGY